MENQEKTNQFETTIKKLTAILGGKENLTQSEKLPNDAISEMVTSLLQEEKERKSTEFKTELKNLLNKYVSMTKEVESKKKELEKLENTKRKEFVDAANLVFSKVDDLASLEKSFYDSINTVKNS